MQTGVWLAISIGVEGRDTEKKLCCMVLLAQACGMFWLVSVLFYIFFACMFVCVYMYACMYVCVGMFFTRGRGYRTTLRRVYPVSEWKSACDVSDRLFHVFFFWCGGCGQKAKIVTPAFGQEHLLRIIY